MIFAIVLAYALLMQEQDKLFKIDREGHVHFLWVRRVIRGEPPPEYHAPAQPQASKK
jgi:hypothetical protein